SGGGVFAPYSAARVAALPGDAERDNTALCTDSPQGRASSSGRQLGPRLHSALACAAPGARVFTGFVKPCPGCGRSSRVRVDSAGAPVPSSTALTERTGMTLRDHPEPCHPIRRIFIAERRVLCDSLAVRHGVVAQRHDVGFGALRDRRWADASSEPAAHGAYGAKILVYAYAPCETPEQESPADAPDEHARSRLIAQNVSRERWCAFA